MRLWIVIGLGAVMASSCNIAKYLDEDQMVIEDIRLTIQDTPKNLDNSALKGELEKLYSIRTNHDLKSTNYYRFKDIEDPKWPKKWRKNKRTQAPALLDESEVEETVQSIESYLRNKKGFQRADVSYEIQRNPKSKKAIVLLSAHTGDQYTINEIRHLTRDSAIIDMVEEISHQSLLKPGDPIDALSFDVEKQRIVSEMQRAGYADFNLTNVEILGDSSDLEKSWDIFFNITQFSETESHKKYSIGNIEIFTDFHQGQKIGQLSSEDRYDKTYHKQNEKYVVRPSTLNRKIYLNKYDVYNSENYYKTLRKLYTLGSYKFARISPKANPDDSALIDYQIFLTPHNRKWVLDLGLESFFSTLTSSTINDELVGVAASVGVEDRNAFGGSEKFSASMQAGLEFNPSIFQDGSNRFVISRSFGLNTKLDIPTLTKPFNIIRPLHKIGIINDGRLQRMEEEGLSSLNFGVNFLDILGFYRVLSVEAEYGYEFHFNDKNRLSFTQINFNYTNYEVVDENFFPDNPVLTNTFVDNLFTSLAFQELTYRHTTERGINRSNFAIISSLEVSGLEVQVLNSLSNAITGSNNVWELNGNTEFEKMFKVGFETIWYSPQTPAGQLAARFKTGLAMPFGSDNDVSYIKQYFVGGPSSIRAWRPMHLGPGTFANDDFFDPTSQTIFFQRGDILIDMSLEYRFDLFWLMEGALFIDAGNIWTIGLERGVDGSIQRPGSNFTADFLSQLAVGYGYGLRFDFTYFLIRFDLGLKLLSPTNSFSFDGIPRVLPRSSRWISPRGQSFGNFNIAVAYPF